MEQIKLYTAYKAEPQTAEYELGKLGGALVKGAELISKGIATGADKAGGLIEYVTDKTQQSLQKAEGDAKVIYFICFFTSLPWNFPFGAQNPPPPCFVQDKLK